ELAYARTDGTHRRQVSRTAPHRVVGRTSRQFVGFQCGRGRRRIVRSIRGHILPELPRLSHPVTPITRIGRAGRAACTHLRQGCTGSRTAHLVSLYLSLTTKPRPVSSPRGTKETVRTPETSM